MSDNQDNDMATTSIRLSRISYPRANIWAMSLLVIVFLGFGIWADATMADPALSSENAMLLTRGLANELTNGQADWLTQLRAVLHV